MAFQAPVTVLQASTKRDTGKKAQYGNIMAGKVRGACCSGAGAAPTRAACSGGGGSAGQTTAAVQRQPPPRPHRPALASRACQAVADIVRTTLGPRAMLKMLLDANGGIVLTNDGAAAAV